MFSEGILLGAGTVVVSICIPILALSLLAIMLAVEGRDMFGAKILIIMTDQTKLSFAERIKLK